METQTAHRLANFGSNAGSPEITKHIAFYALPEDGPRRRLAVDNYSDSVTDDEWDVDPWEAATTVITFQPTRPGFKAAYSLARACRTFPDRVAWVVGVDDIRGLVIDSSPGRCRAEA